MLSQSRNSRYRRELEAVSQSAIHYIDGVLRSERKVNPNISIAELRNKSIEAIRDSANIFGDQSASLAIELLEEMAQDAGVDVDTMIEDVIDHNYTERYIRYHVAKAKEDYYGFESRIQDLAKYYVFRAAQENMIRNCKRNNLRYARVPSGSETCGFCFMLSSRGFVYKTEESAGSHNKFHMHCDCIVVPGFKDIHHDKQIAGYEPTKMAHRYNQCLKTIGGESNLKKTWKSLDESKKLAYKGKNEAAQYQQFKTAEITKELNTRDWKWLYTGVEPEITYEQGANPKRHEQATANTLAKNGYRVVFRKVAYGYRDKTSDIYILQKNDNIIKRIPWEFKSPQGDGKQTIYHQFEEAAGQSKNLIIDLARAGEKLDFNDACKEVDKKIHWSYKVKDEKGVRKNWVYDQVIVIDRSGTMKKFKK